MVKKIFSFKTHKKNELEKLKLNFYFFFKLLEFSSAGFERLV